MYKQDLALNNLQSGFSRVYFNSCCSCSFEAEILKIGQSSHKMYSNNILNFQESTTILNANTKKVWKHRMYLISLFKDISTFVVDLILKAYCRKIVEVLFNL